MDILSILGVIIGFGAIIVGQYLEGGELSAILNPVALLSVLRKLGCNISSSISSDRAY